MVLGERRRCSFDFSTHFDIGSNLTMDMVRFIGCYCWRSGHAAMSKVVCCAMDQTHTQGEECIDDKFLQGHHEVGKGLPDGHQDQYIAGCGKEVPVALFSTREDVAVIS